MSKFHELDDGVQLAAVWAVVVVVLAVLTAAGVTITTVYHDASLREFGIACIEAGGKPTSEARAGTTGTIMTCVKEK